MTIPRGLIAVLTTLLAVGTLQPQAEATPVVAAPPAASDDAVTVAEEDPQPEEPPLEDPPAGAHAVIATPSRSFSPELDGGLGLDFCVIDPDFNPAHVVVDVLDADGQVVATPYDQSDVWPSESCEPWYGGSGWTWWDGTDSAGEPLPDGPYTVRVSLPDLDDPATSAEREFAIDTAPVGEFTSPLEGEALTESTPLVFTPAPGRTVESVEFTLSPIGADGWCQLQAVADPTGAWVAPIDTGDCGPGPWIGQGSATWTDDYGFLHEPVWSHGLGAGRDLRIDANALLAPSSPEDPAGAWASWCAVDTTAESLHVTARILDGQGTEVVVLSDSDRAPDSIISALREECSGEEWTGLDGAGERVPDGTYTFEVSADNGVDAPLVRTREILVDSTVPGTITSPAADARIGADTPVVFTATEGIAVDSVSFQFSSIDQSTCTASPEGVDGVWTATAPISSEDGECGAAPYSVSAWVSWTDPFGNSRDYETATVGRQSELRIFGRQEFWAESVDVEPENGAIDLGWCAVDSEAAQPIHVVATIHDADGAAVRALADEDSATVGLGDCDEWDHVDTWWNGTDDAGDLLPAGDYELRVRAVGTDPGSTLDLAGSRPLLISIGAPGAITSPADGGKATAETPLTFTASEDVDVDQVSFQLQGRSAWCMVAAAAVDGDPSTWTVAAGSLPEDCEGGPWLLSADVTWTGRYGDEHWLSTAFQGITYGVTFDAPDVMALEQPNSLESSRLAWCVTTHDREVEHHVVARILDAAGDVVANLADDYQYPDWADAAVSGCAGSQWWSGRDDDDQSLPAGEYVLDVVATPTTGGDPITARHPISIDRRIPGLLTTPTPWSAFAEEMPLVAEVLPDLEVSGVEFVVRAGDGQEVTVAGANEGGQVWEATADVSALRRTASAHAVVTWVDDLGGTHDFRTDLAYGLDVGNDPGVLLSSDSGYLISPNGDGFADTWTGRACATAVATSSPEQRLRVAVLDGAGTEVAVVTDETIVLSRGDRLLEGCSGGLTFDGRDATGADLPDGDYDVLAEIYTGTGPDATVSDRHRINLTIDRATGGTILTPSPHGAFDTEASVAFEPAPGFTPTSVSAQILLRVPDYGYYSCAWGGTETADEDGIWRPAISLGNEICGLQEEAELVVVVNWQAVTDEGWTTSHSAQQTVPIRLTAPPVFDDVAVETTRFDPADDADGLAVEACAVDAHDGGDLTFDLEVLDGTGTTVRSIGPVAAAPAQPWCDSWFDSSAPSLHWDGTDDTGADLPAGLYALRLTATDHDDLSTSATREVRLDRGGVGTVTEPADGTSVSGGIQLGYTPAPGIVPSYVRFQVAADGNQPCASGYASKDLDGVWRAPLDTVAAGCGDGPRTVRAKVEWSDPSGDWIVRRTPPIAITLTNPAVAPTVQATAASPRVFSPDGDGNDEQIHLPYCVKDSTYGDLVDTTVVVRDNGGQVVRTLVDGAIKPFSSCQWGGTSVPWDGRDDAGAPVPDGQYTLRVHATDAGGLTGSATSPIFLVDRRVPGSVTSPAPDAQVSVGDTVTFEPADGFAATAVYVNVTRARVNSVGQAECYLEAAKDPDTGRWHATITDECGAGPATLDVRASWTDSLGTGHTFEAPPIPITIAGELRLHVQASPRSYDPADGDMSAWWCVRSADPTPVHVRLTVRNDQDALVRTLVNTDDSPDALCNGSWYGDGGMGYWNGAGRVPVPDGAYTLRLEATDATGTTTTKDLAIEVDRRGAGTPVSPVAGDVLAGTATLVFRPAEGRTLDQVQLAIDTSGGSISGNATWDAPTGTWRAQVPVGQLTAGDGTVRWWGRWTDTFGLFHYFNAPEIPVVVDTTRLPLSISCACGYPHQGRQVGEAPYDARIGVTTSDPFGAPVDVSVDWGDGSAPTTTTSATPYAELDLTHAYPEVGFFTVTVTASNSRGTTTRTSGVQVVEDVPDPDPNTPPTVGVGTTPQSGVAPLQVTTTVEGTDPDDDTLTYTVSFGDGSAPVTGSLPTAPLTHTYATGGTYLVRTAVTDGRSPAIIRLATVTVGLDEPLTAVAGDDLVVPAGTPVVLDGGASRPALGITRYRWEYGDNTAGQDGAVHQHTYSQPGTYTAVLTVWAGQESKQDAVTVTVTPVSTDPGLTVRVRRTNGAALAGADVAYQFPDGSRVSAVSDSTGAAVLPGLPDGYQRIYVAKAGYLPGSVTAQVTDGGGEAVVQLESGEVLAADLEVDRLTEDEIVAAGIDPEAPGNQVVNQFTFTLAVSGSTVSFSGYVNGGGGWPACPSIDGVNMSCGTGGGGGGSACYDSGDTHVCLQPSVVGDKPQLVVLQVPGKASWLKEFFNATMTVVNLATDPANVIDNGTATITVPSGMSLAPTSTPQSLTRAVPAIPAGGSQAVSWILRGDTEGDYDLAAAYVGTLQPTATPVQVEARTDEPVHVWGASAIDVRIDADDTAYGNWDYDDSSPFLQERGAHPFHVTVTAKNVADVPVYNLELALSEAGAEGFVYQPGLDLDTAAGELGPGEELAIDAILVPSVSGEVLLDESFEVSAAGKTFGADAVTTHPRSRAPEEDPELSVLQGVGKALLTLDTVAGASSYEIYAISGPDGEFRKIPAADVDWVDTEGASLRAVVRGIDPEVDRYWLVTSIVDGTPVMEHRLVALPADVHRPTYTIDYGTPGGTIHACDERVFTVSVHFRDSFGMESWTITGDQLDPDLGETAQLASTLVRDDVGTTGVPFLGDTVTVEFSGTNIAGDSVEDSVTFDRDCPIHEVVVVAAGLKSNLDSLQPSEVLAPVCPEDGDRDAWNVTWATNACPAEFGLPTGEVGNLLAHLEELGFDAGPQRYGVPRDVLEFSYLGADVDCEGQPSLSPSSYPSQMTWLELLELGAHLDYAARSYFYSLRTYAHCWRLLKGEQLEFTFVGHSEGGYEALALARIAAEEKEADRDSIDVGGVLTLDGALHPRTILSTIGMGCATANPWVSVPVDVALFVGRAGASPANLSEYLIEREGTAAAIRLIQKHGGHVATYTNRNDSCLEEAATINVAADEWGVFDVHHEGWNGMTSHTAILRGHTSEVSQPGYPILPVLDRVLENGADLGTAASGGWRSEGSPLSKQALRGLGASESVSSDCPAGNVLSGTVTGGTGSQASGQIVVVGTSGQRLAAVAPDGHFEVCDLPTGDYQVYVSPGVAGWSGRWIGGTDRASARVFHVDGETSTGAISGIAPVRTTIVASDTSGNVVADAIVAVRDSDNRLAAIVEADETGHAEVSIAPGRYTFWTGSATTVAVALTVDATAESSGATQGVTLQPAALIDTTMTDASGAPLPASIVALYQGDQVVATAITDEDGIAHFAVEPGDYDVRLYDPYQRITPPTSPVTIHPDLGDAGTVDLAFEDGKGFAPAIAPTTLPGAVVGTPYTAQLEAVGEPSYAVTSGSLPPGLTLSPEGAITGTPTTAGSSAFTVTATNPAGTDAVELTIVVAPAVKLPFTVSTKPRIGGTPKVGKVLKVRAAVLTPAPAVVRYQWLRNGTAIRGATKAKYLVTRKDRGKKLSVRVTYTKPGYKKLVIVTKAVLIK